MPEQGTWIWMDGEWLPWADATVHVSVHALHYGSSVFEGIRAYETPSGPAVFRLEDHLRRMADSAKLMRMDLPFDPQVLESACLELVERNGHGACYLRPLAFRGSGSLAVDGQSLPVHIVLLSFEWGAYLGDEALEHGIDAAVSSWRRFAPDSLAPLGKIGGQYVNNQFVSAEARLHGYEEGIVLDTQGQICEGGGENLFLVRDGALITPPVSASILAGITRDTVLHLAGDLGVAVREAAIPRDLLYLADEVFMTGTAAEITPVRSVDRIPIGSGARGPITARLQREFFRVVRGETTDRHGWLTHIRPEPDVHPSTRPPK
ncbi:MAG: branched-chain amino acid transaminase [Holophagales bacterium]|nr:branched-chain amino acid transaminase [Holophagales bacterium]